MLYHTLFSSSAQKEKKKKKIQLSPNPPPNSQPLNIDILPICDIPITLTSRLKFNDSTVSYFDPKRLVLFIYIYIYNIYILRDLILIGCGLCWFGVVVSVRVRTGIYTHWFRAYRIPEECFGGGYDQVGTTHTCIHTAAGRFYCARESI